MERAAESLKGRLRASLKEKAAEIGRDVRERMRPAGHGEVQFAEPPIYRCAEPHGAQSKSECLVIACNSFRFLRQTQEFLFGALGLNDYDLMAVPGGVQWLALPDLLPKHNKVARGVAEYVVNKHGIKRAVCIAHEGCSAYRDEGTLGALAHMLTGKNVFEHQVEQLRRVGRNLKTWFGVETELYYASVDDGAVVFHRVALAAEEGAK